MVGGIIIGGRLNLTVSFINCLSCQAIYPSPSFTYFYLHPRSPFPHPLASSEFCAELPAIIIIALLLIVPATQASKLYCDAPNPFSIYGAFEVSNLSLRVSDFYSLHCNGFTQIGNIINFLL